MDKKFGPAWQVVVGKGFSYEVQYEVGIYPDVTWTCAFCRVFVGSLALALLCSELRTCVCCR